MISYKLDVGYEKRPGRTCYLMKFISCKKNIREEAWLN